MSTNFSVGGAGQIAAKDYHAAKYVGKTKGGQSLTITLPRAISLTNPEWTFAEKDDVVPEITFDGVYSDSALAAGDRTEPWTMTGTDWDAGNAEIVLGVGLFYIGPTGDDYDATATYAVGDFCVHDNAPYVCKTAITTGETWTEGHWDPITWTPVGLTRGGGAFKVEREFRDINADNDPGRVYGRISKEGGKPTLSFKALQWLTKVGDLYATNTKASE